MKPENNFCKLYFHYYFEAYSAVQIFNIHIFAVVKLLIEMKTNRCKRKISLLTNHTFPIHTVHPTTPLTTKENYTLGLGIG